MIHIERPPEPEWWREAFPGSEKDRARSFYSRPEASRRQERFDWGRESFGQAIGSAIRALGSLFGNKCAYCESKVESGLLGQHRPFEQAAALDGTVSPDHYWWLAWEWSNALLICAECATSKSTYFPVQGPRAEPESSPHALLAELPLFLDPTLDAPEEHLSFQLVGTYEVKARTERGEVTIQYLNLNRPELLRQRAEVVAQTLGELVRWRDSSGLGKDLEGVSRVLATDRPHCGIRRQLVAWAANEWHVLYFYLRHSKEFRALEPLLVRYGLNPPQQQTSPGRRSLSVPGEPGPTDAPTPPATPPPPPAPTSTQPPPHRHLRRITLENFKGIEHLELEFSFTTQANPSAAPWLMLLGENGQGKSSVLQAVALALMPAEQRRAAIERPGRARLVRRGAEAAGARVTLELADGQSVGFTINRKGRMEGTSPPMLLCAYGSTRLLPRGEHQPPKPASVLAHAANLFDPFLPLTDAQRWLLATEGSDRARFDYAARSIKGILDLGNERFFEPSTDHREIEVRFDDERPPVTLSELSDGYQAMLAMAVDLMAHASAVQPVVGEARGLVLVDELGLHMHPRWRMRVVEGLRAAFPYLQFLCTTHDPLCLRGLYRGEVAVMRRDQEERIVALTKDLPDVAALRVDQLLTSEYFGLQTAMDPAMETRFAEYYHLLSQHAPTPVQEARLAALKAELAGKEMLGSSERERLMYEAIDLFLARKSELKSDSTRVAVPALKEDLLAELQDIWDEA